MTNANGIRTERPAPAERHTWLAGGLVPALAAGVISISALGVSIYEAALDRRHFSASVLPVMEVWVARSADLISFHAANKGLGPARVRQVEITLGATRVASGWDEVFRFFEVGIPQEVSMSMLTGNTMLPGEEVRMLAASTEAEGGLDIASMGMNICYCSVLETCWLLAMPDLLDGRSDTERIDRCDSDGGAF